jgi:protocatechuate 3,4-dioxygenase beta subunit
MYVEGRVLTSKGEPIPGAVIETWETDEKGTVIINQQHLFDSFSSSSA